MIRRQESPQIMKRPLSRAFEKIGGRNGAQSLLLLEPDSTVSYPAALLPPFYYTHRKRPFRQEAISSGIQLFPTLHSAVGNQGIDGEIVVSENSITFTTEASTPYRARIIYLTEIDTIFLSTLKYRVQLPLHVPTQKKISDLYTPFSKANNINVEIVRSDLFPVVFTFSGDQVVNLRELLVKIYSRRQRLVNEELKISTGVQLTNQEDLKHAQCHQPTSIDRTRSNEYIMRVDLRTPHKGLEPSPLPLSTTGVNLPETSTVRHSYAFLFTRMAICSAKKYRKRAKKFNSIVQRSNWLQCVSSYLKVAQCLRERFMTPTLEDALVLQSPSAIDLRVINSLLQVIYCPECRTLRGFQALIEKHWIRNTKLVYPHGQRQDSGPSFLRPGAPSFRRSKSPQPEKPDIQMRYSVSSGARPVSVIGTVGLLNADAGRFITGASDASDNPHRFTVNMEYLLLFLECVHNMMAQSPPTLFQFSSLFLVRLWHDMLGGVLGEPAEGSVDAVLDRNPLYAGCDLRVLSFHGSIVHLDLWEDLWCQWLPSRQTLEPTGSTERSIAMPMCESTALDILSLTYALKDERRQHLCERNLLSELGIRRVWPDSDFVTGVTLADYEFNSIEQDTSDEESTS